MTWISEIRCLHLYILMKDYGVSTNVVGNSMTTQASDSNPTKNEQTNNKKRKFEQ